MVTNCIVGAALSERPIGQVVLETLDLVELRDALSAAYAANEQAGPG